MPKNVARTFDLIGRFDFLEALQRLRPNVLVGLRNGPFRIYKLLSPAPARSWEQYLEDPGAAPFVTSLRLWAAENYISENDAWLFEAALKTLKKWRDDGPGTGFQYDAPLPWLELRIEPWYLNLDHKWVPYQKNAKAVFNQRLKDYKLATEFLLGKRYKLSCVHAEWTVLRMFGDSYPKIAKNQNKQPVQRAVEKFAKRINLTLPK